MKAETTPSSSEAARLAALRRYQILDTAAEPSFDSLARLATAICQTPVALISLVDEHRQWLKSKIGIEISETPRSVAFCAQTILYPDLLIVPDALVDERFASNPLVVTDPRIRFYAGVPLVTPDGHALGALCVIDYAPRMLRAEQTAALQTLGEQVMAQLELRHKNIHLEQTAAALRLTEERYRFIYEENPTICFTLNLDGVVLSVNQHGAEQLGYKVDELVGQSGLMVVAADDRDIVHRRFVNCANGVEPVVRGELRKIRKDGSEFTARDTMRLVQDNHGNKVILIVCQDITIFRREAEKVRAQLITEKRAHRATAVSRQYFKHLASHDALTGLPNRNLFHDRLEQAIIRARRQKTTMAILFLDLNKFKDVNDRLGHATGDLLLQAVANWLNSVVRSGDTIARFGGDEFALILENLNNRQDATHVVQQILHSLPDFFEAGKHRLAITPSIGISVYPDDGETSETLLNKADVAMYTAKKMHKKHYQYYRAGLKIRSG